MNFKLPKKITWVWIRNMVLFLIATVLVVVYVSGGMLLHDIKLADQIVLCPNVFKDTYEISIPGVKKQTIAIPTSDGQKLDAWLFVIPGATKLTIVNHGNAGNLTSRGLYAQVFTQAKTNVLLYDYRGYGNSTGAATVRGILEDGETVYSYARNKLNYSADKIIEFGESIGTAVACHIAAKEKCCALMLFAPLDSLPSAGKWKVAVLRIYPDFCFAEQLNNIDLIKKNHAPVFICHGKKDDTLRAQGAQSLYDAANEPKKLVYLPDSGHYQMPPADMDLYLKSISQFVAALP